MLFLKLKRIKEEGHVYLDCNDISAMSHHKYPTIIYTKTNQEFTVAEYPDRILGMITLGQQHLMERMRTEDTPGPVVAYINKIGKPQVEENDK